ncbi:hypothetical protein EMCRGX_G016370 [Ephydatia muelleri]
MDERDSDEELPSEELAEAEPEMEEGREPTSINRDPLVVKGIKWTIVDNLVDIRYIPKQRAHILWNRTQQLDSVVKQNYTSASEHEEDSPPGGPPDPESDTDDIVISVFINKIINPDKSFGSSDPMCILLLCTTLLSASGAYCPKHSGLQQISTDTDV